VSFFCAIFWICSFIDTNSLYFGKEVKVEKGYYYRLRGYHSCTKNGVLENGASRTNGIYIG
jgi:hypothetical protein